MVYDCFPFFNELDLLELRLNEHKDVVDYHVLVECTKTFQKQNKTLHYEENKDRFKEFNHKIIHIILDDIPDLDPWGIEYLHRDKAASALINCNDEDIILITDADEIVSPSAIRIYQQNPVKKPKALSQRAYYYWMNCMVSNSCVAPVIADYANLKKYSRISELRVRRDELDRMYLGGWHFSYLGGADKIIEKIQSFAHSEYNTPDFLDKDRILNIINNGFNLYDGNNGVLVPIDNSFPKYLVENKDKFAQYLK